VDETPPKPPQQPGMPPPPDEGNEARKARIVVVGDSDFCTDGLIQALGGLGKQNLAFAVMAINWVVKNEKLVAIPPKEPAEKPFSVTDAQKRFTWVLTVGVVPLLIILAGSLVWWIRRRS